VCAWVDVIVNIIYSHIIVSDVKTLLSRSEVVHFIKRFTVQPHTKGIMTKWSIRKIIEYLSLLSAAVACGRVTAVRRRGKRDGEDRAS